jgi:hypothetical protein
VETGEQTSTNDFRGFWMVNYMSSAIVISPSMILRIWLWINHGVLCISIQKTLAVVGFGMQISADHVTPTVPTGTNKVT